MEALFWICLLDLPLMARNEYMGHLIGHKIDRVVEVDIKEDKMAWGKFMQVIVSLDVINPLLRGKKIN